MTEREYTKWEVEYLKQLKKTKRLAFIKDVLPSIVLLVLIVILLASCVNEAIAEGQAHLNSRLPAGMDVDFTGRTFTTQLSEAQSSDYSEPITERGEVQMTDLGEWTVTFYCNCPECCGEWSGCNTASGVPPTSKYTIATDALPFGTVVYIQGHGIDGFYTVEDRGVPYGWVDVYVDSHEEALQLGMGTVRVFRVEV